MTRGQKALGTLAMFLLILALLITSFQLAIYGDPQYGFYETEYEKYQVTRSLGMETVSYTHLDVYKRQGEGRGGQEGQGIRGQRDPAMRGGPCG